MVRILGLDPGLRHTGWGIIEVAGNRLTYVAHGVIDSHVDNSLPQRLNQLHEGLNLIIDLYRPDEAAVEETFVNKNPVSTLKLGMARGVVLFTPVHKGLNVWEYSANKVKKSVVGAGHAEKNQVAMMVQRLLAKCNVVAADGADALAVAICHAHYRSVNALLRQA